MAYSIGPTGLRLTDFSTTPEHRLPAHGHHWPVVVLVHAGRLEQQPEGTLSPGGVRLAPAGAAHDLILYAGTRLTVIECDPNGLVGSHPLWRQLKAAILRSADDVGRPLHWRSTPVGYPGGASLEVEDDLLRLLSAEARKIDGRPLRPVPAELAALHDAIVADPGAALRPGALADRLGVHRVQLGRLAREFLGRPLWHVVMSARLNQARGYLLDTSLAVARIADLSGFCDQSHLHRAFRRRFGVGPGEFRRMYQASKTQREASATFS